MFFPYLRHQISYLDIPVIEPAASISKVCVLGGSNSLKSHTRKLIENTVPSVSFFPFVFSTQSVLFEPISVIFFVYIIHYELISQIPQLQSLHSSYVLTFEWMSSQVENEFISVWLYYQILLQANKEQCLAQENKEQLFIEMSRSLSSLLPSVQCTSVRAWLYTQPT